MEQIRTEMLSKDPATGDVIQQLFGIDMQVRQEKNFPLFLENVTFL